MPTCPNLYHKGELIAEAGSILLLYHCVMLSENGTSLKVSNISWWLTRLPTWNGNCVLIAWVAETRVFQNMWRTKDQKGGPVRIFQLNFAQSGLVLTKNNTLSKSIIFSTDTDTVKDSEAQSDAEKPKKPFAHHQNDQSCYLGQPTELRLIRRCWAAPLLLHFRLPFMQIRVPTSS